MPKKDALSFTDALNQFKAARLRANDLKGYWTADLHQAEKTPPLDRYIHEYGVVTTGWLLMMEGKGLFPKGWTNRHSVAICFLVRKSVLDVFTAESFPDLSPDEIRDASDNASAGLAQAIRDNPGEIETLQASLEESNGGPFEMPG